MSLTSPQEPLLWKEPSIANTEEVNWYEVCKDFTKFLNQLRPYKAHTKPKPEC